MRRIIMSLNITPDGFCDHTSVVADEEHHTSVNELLKSADTVLLGRVTFELFESYWPSVAKSRKGSEAEIEFADLIQNAEKIVFSKSLKNVDWENTNVQKEIDPDFLMKLKQKSGKDILIFGSPGIVSQLADLGLIDKYNFMIQPMIVGKGKRLFESLKLNKALNLKLTNTVTFQSGVSSIWYEPVTEK